MGFHNNRYRHWYEKTWSKDEIKSFFKNGWSDLIDEAFQMVSYIPNGNIFSAKRCMGMLHMFGHALDDKVNNNALEGILWKIERLSSIICEGCGKRGKRRKELKTIYCFCQKCYMEYLSGFDNPEKLFKKSELQLPNKNEIKL